MSGPGWGSGGAAASHARALRAAVRACRRRLDSTRGSYEGNRLDELLAELDALEREPPSSADLSPTAVVGRDHT